MKKKKLTKEQKRLETLAVKTEEHKIAFLAQLEKYPIVQVACEKTGIGRSTYYLWRKDDEYFAKKADKALKSGVSFINDLAESKLITNIQDGSTPAIKFWLGNRHDSYRSRIRNLDDWDRDEIEETLKSPDMVTQQAMGLYNGGIITKYYRNDMIIRVNGKVGREYAPYDEGINEEIEAQKRGERIDEFTHSGVNPNKPSKLNKDYIELSKKGTKRIKESEENIDDTEYLGIKNDTEVEDTENKQFKRPKKKGLDLKEFFRKRAEQKKLEEMDKKKPK